jgi:uncharacterized protein
MLPSVQRHHYLEQMKVFIGVPLIKVLTGQRRVGKSTLLKQLSSAIEPAKLVWIDMEQKVYDTFLQEDQLYIFLKHEISLGKNRICIDEIQHIAHWEHAMLSIFSEYPHVEIWIT